MTFGKTEEKNNKKNPTSVHLRFGVSICKNPERFFEYSNLLDKVFVKMNQDHVLCRFQRRLKLEFLRERCQSETTRKRAAIRAEKLEATHQHQKTEVFPERDLCCSQPWLCSVRGDKDRLILNSVCLLPSLLFPSPLLHSILACLSFPLMGFPVSLPPLFPVLLLSPSSLAHFLCQYVCLPQRETQPWRLTLAVVLFMEAENYAVTFPAFLLEISNRSGLSVQDRDPGGGETGCCYNHFLPHHFLQVD